MVPRSLDQARLHAAYADGLGLGDPDSRFAASGMTA